MYLQITSQADKGFNCRELMQYLDVSLGVAEGERFKKSKVSGLALQLFTRMDENRDGLVGLEDLLSFRTRLRKAFAPTHSLRPEIVSEAAQKRFRSMCTSESLDFKTLLQQIKNRLAITLPFRGLIAQTSALLLLETSTNMKEIPIRKRLITEEEWINTAIELIG